MEDGGRKEKLLRRETKGEKYSRAGVKKDKQGEITEAVSWKLARTFQISLNLYRAHIRSVLYSQRVLFLCVCVVLSIFKALTENKCHKIITETKNKI